MNKPKGPFDDLTKLVSCEDLGDMVLCDVCNEEYTPDNGISGGFLFGSYAYCPKCAERRLPEIKKLGEEQHITAWCPPEISFHHWIMQLRGGDNTIKVWTNEDKP